MREALMSEVSMPEVLSRQALICKTFFRSFASSSTMGPPISASADSVKHEALRDLRRRHREADDLLALQPAQEARRLVPGHRFAAELQPDQAALRAVDDP